MDLFSLSNRYDKNLYSKSDLSMIHTIYLISRRLRNENNLRLQGKKIDNSSNLPYIPDELWDMILFKYACKLKIKIGNKYISRKEDKDGRIKEQVVTVDSIGEYDNNQGVYASYYYGVYGFHEGFCRLDQLREMTEEEKEHSVNNRYWNLPQQFYQSSPS